MRLLDALHRVPLDRPPVWFMRQAGRYLPEYREMRERHSFSAAVHRPEIAAELTLQPVRRFRLDAAIVFSDIMTPLEAMGVTVEFAPGPRLAPMTAAEVAGLPALDPERMAFLAETLTRVRGALTDDVALVGFAGGPFTLLAYLLEGGGSKGFLAVRAALHADLPAATAALTRLATAMHTHLRLQVEAGADVVQLFDSWAGNLSRDQFLRFAVPAARRALAGLPVPTVYFVPAAGHLLDLLPEVGATAYGVDWRQPLGRAWERVGLDRPIQGNLDPAVLLAGPREVRAAVAAVLAEAGGRPGHVFNLGHGVDRRTPVGNVAAMVEAVREAAR